MEAIPYTINRHGVYYFQVRVASGGNIKLSFRTDNPTVVKNIISEISEDIYNVRQGFMTKQDFCDRFKSCLIKFKLSCAVRRKRRKNNLVTKDDTIQPGCYVYVQKLVAPFYSCLKIGITHDPKERLGQQQLNSLFRHSLLFTKRFDSRVSAMQVEKTIKANFTGSRCFKEWLPDGWTETYELEDLDKILEIIGG